MTTCALVLFDSSFYSRACINRVNVNKVPGYFTAKNLDKRPSQIFSFELMEKRSHDKYDLFCKAIVTAKLQNQLDVVC